MSRRVDIRRHGRQPDAVLLERRLNGMIRGRRGHLRRRRQVGSGVPVRFAPLNFLDRPNGWQRHTLSQPANQRHQERDARSPTEGCPVPSPNEPLGPARCPCLFRLRGTPDADRPSTTGEHWECEGAMKRLIKLLSGAFLEIGGFPGGRLGEVAARHPPSRWERAGWLRVIVVRGMPGRGSGVSRIGLPTTF